MSRDIARTRSGLRLPDTDPDRSPVTGWSRAHWEAVADQLLDAVAGYATPGFAQYRLPGRASISGARSDGLEGFARTFLLAVFRIAGAGGVGCERLVERYASGLADGTDPASPHAWPPIKDRSQPMVEAAAIAVALHESRPWIWDQLSIAVQDRLRGWLEGFVGRHTERHNWMLFQTVTEQFLATVGGRHRREEIERGLDALDEWYLGDGWYTDGHGKAGHNVDYYNGWALHLYPLLWTRMADTVGGDGGRGEIYRQRLRAFLDGYAHFFGPDGAPVHHGRSLTYRLACVAPFWLGQLCAATPLAPGVTRRLASGVLRHFTEHGVPDERGLLTLGWYRPFLPATQAYSGPGSPYWAAKGFLGLLLPPFDPVWTDREQPAPNDLDDHVVALPGPGLLLHSTRDDGIVRLLNHGNGKDDPHYAKFAYSSRTAPDTADHAWAANVDNHVAVLRPDGTVTRRARLEPLAVRGRLAASRHTAGEHRLTTTVIARGPYEVRVHLIDGPAATIRDGGYAIAGDAPPRVRWGPGWAAAHRSDGLTSAIVALHGFGEAAAHTDHDANAFGPSSATPYLLANREAGETVQVSLVVLSGGTVDPDALRRTFAVRVHDHHVTVRFPDGDETVLTGAGQGASAATRNPRLAPEESPEL